MKFAYFVRPHLGGTYTLFQQLRAGLMTRGVDLQWVGLGYDKADGGLRGSSHSASGFFVTPARSDAEQAAALIEALEENNFDGVFINVLADQLQMNIARYLPPSMLRVMVVHNITPGTYAAAHSIRDNVHATVGVSDRCRNDLIRNYKFAPAWTVTIPNAIDVAAYAGFARTPRSASLRVLFLGRVEDVSKGVFWLPKIIDQLPPSVSLTVAGDGPDLNKLKKRLARHSGRVTLLGGVPPEKIPSILSKHDVLIMPSRFEGFGFTIVEAMAAGCVPVVSRIHGVTDMIVKHEVSGLLFPVGDWRQAAHEIKKLESRPLLLAEISRNAQQAAAQGFGLETMSGAYFALIEKLRRNSPPTAPPLPIEAWSLPGGLQPGLRTAIPKPMKNWLRVVRERLSS
ncbi:glycosyltransferase family 4 protein [Chelativorans sp. YIM 93263]|uniref:glycosyltransferase family 4 protein n=1 Tax=Chelativorans sp. YIM 93263 TaxID=2906648 RepID=UPI002377D953|nr:glycosyltransferase family 4 protein [Chelativorans sp. YIM 93263]